MAQLEAKMRAHVLEQEKVLAAEIVDRQNKIKVLDGRVSDVDDRARLGILGLQTAVGSVEKKANKAKTQTQPSNHDEMYRLQAQNAEGIREQVARDVAKLDHRLSDVEAKMKQHTHDLDHKLQSAKAEEQEANTIMGDKMQQKIDSVIFSQDRLKKQVDKLQNDVQVRDERKLREQEDSILRRDVERFGTKYSDLNTKMKGVMTVGAY
ncbi:hypothetical protein GWK47_046085 [Chionoecetes opilio]|uniref:Uncharacterized protein n=1 Tax=Chionoecetes opilio TaxID=41210 RepID=A0A8J4Y6L1_CHIOP|nr:hypothetical protein GWK47_046085 [Chionoecetes opilio]